MCLLSLLWRKLPGPNRLQFLLLLTVTGLFTGLLGWTQRIGSLSGRGCHALRTEGLREASSSRRPELFRGCLSFYWQLEASVTNANFLRF